MAERVQLQSLNKAGLIFKVLDFWMLVIIHLVIRCIIVVKNRSQGVIIHLQVGEIIYIYIYICSVNRKLWSMVSIWDNYIIETDAIVPHLGDYNLKAHPEIWNSKSADNSCSIIRILGS